MQPTVDNSRYALAANHIPVISVGNYPMGHCGEGNVKENPYMQICFCPRQLQPRWQAGEHTTLTNYHAVIGPEFS